MAKQLTDDEQNIRRKSRRRLIGAFALTLAVVVILPMVLDSQPNPARPDIDLRIPDAEQVGAFVPEMKGSESVEIMPSSAPQAVATVIPELPPVKLPVVAAKKEISPKNTVKSTIVTDGFVAQVGAYSNADTAKQELAKLKKWGFKAYTEKAAGVTRVRIGPYTDREKAEKVGQLLEKHGLHPVILSTKGS